MPPRPEYYRHCEQFHTAFNRFNFRTHELVDGWMLTNWFNILSKDQFSCINGFDAGKQYVFIGDVTRRPTRSKSVPFDCFLFSMRSCFCRVKESIDFSMPFVLQPTMWRLFGKCANPSYYWVIPGASHGRDEMWNWFLDVRIVAKDNDCGIISPHFTGSFLIGVGLPNR